MAKWMINIIPQKRESVSEKLELIPLHYEGLIFDPVYEHGRLTIHILDQVDNKSLATISAEVWQDETVLNRMFKMIGGYFS